MNALETGLRVTLPCTELYTDAAGNSLAQVTHLPVSSLNIGIKVQSIKVQSQQREILPGARSKNEGRRGSPSRVH